MNDQNSEQFVHTRNGNMFSLDPQKLTVPLIDLVLSLARLPRWTGNTVVDWTVAQHALVTAMVAARRGLTPPTILYALMHDIEEAIVNDTPRPFKTEEQIAIGDSVRKTIYKYILKLPYPFEGAREAVRKIDVEMLHTEAQILMHPRAREHYEPANMEIADLIWEMVGEDRQTVVRAFMTLYESLRRDATIRSLEGRV